MVSSSWWKRRSALVYSPSSLKKGLGWSTRYRLEVTRRCFNSGMAARCCKRFGGGGEGKVFALEGR